MDPIIIRVKSTISKFRMLSSGQSVCVALSGGPDSTALLTILHELSGSTGFILKACHFDHAFRPDSAEDAKIARQTANRLGLEIVTEKNESGKPSSSLQEKARNMRYAFFQRLLDTGYADLIATGHTMDDSVETSIMWMLRGAGPAAFGGLPPVRDKYIRPLIETRKKEIVAWLGDRGIGYKTDPTNATDDYLRNRIRHHIVQAMETEAPKAVEAISRLSRLVAEQGAVVDKLGLEMMERFRKSEKTAGITLDALKVSKEPEAIRFSIYRAALAAIGVGAGRLQLCHVDAVDQLVMLKALGKNVDMPDGYTVAIDHGGLTFCVEPQAHASFAAPFSSPLEMKVGGRVLTVSPDIGSGENAGIADRGNVPERALFRTRQPGDFLQLTNMKGRKTLKTFLIDRKTPSGIRDSMPFLAVDNEILWVPGLFLSPSIMAAESSKNRVALLWD